MSLVGTLRLIALDCGFSIALYYAVSTRPFSIRTKHESQIQTARVVIVQQYFDSGIDIAFRILIPTAIHLFMYLCS